MAATVAVGDGLLLLDAFVDLACRSWAAALAAAVMLLFSEPDADTVPFGAGLVLGAGDVDKRELPG